VSPIIKRQKKGKCEGENSIFFVSKSAFGLLMLLSDSQERRPLFDWSHAVSRMRVGFHGKVTLYLY
jgi:hypothetical protein